jgi:hypothetical protein
MSGKCGQVTTGDPSAEIRSVDYTRRDRKKGGPREYTHTHMGVHEDRGDLKKMGKKRDVTRPSSVVSSIKRDAVCLNRKFKKCVTKNFDRNDKEGKVEMRNWVNSNFQ